MSNITLEVLLTLVNKLHREDKIRNADRMVVNQIRTELQKIKYIVNYNENTQEHELRPLMKMRNREVITLA